MAEPDRCDLHEVVLFLGPGESETLLELARSPIADECRICPVCRLAREFMETRFAEMSGEVFPPGRNAEAVRLELQAAVNAVKVSHHRAA